MTYDYFLIRSNSAYTDTTEVAPLANFLVTKLGLEKQRNFAYVFPGGAGSIRLVLAVADSNGNYAVFDRDKVDDINLVEIMCDSNCTSLGHNVAMAIAEHLGWEMEYDQTE